MTETTLKAVRAIHDLPLPELIVRAQTVHREHHPSGEVQLCSLLSVPLFARDKVLGAINIYTKEQRMFTDDEVDFVKVVAGQAATAIENARLMSETLEMKRTLETRKLVERAKGILQYKHNLTEEEAYLRLRNESRRLRRPMRDLAEAVIMADDLNKGQAVARSQLVDGE